jgi:hypothetical protein
MNLPAASLACRFTTPAERSTMARVGDCSVDIGSNDIWSVVFLCRYPVKSMMGEEMNVSHITATGLLGDRAYALPR